MTDINGGVGRIAVAISRHPREFVGIVMATLAVFAIFINALFLQHGPHPAPIFATRAPTAPEAPVLLPRPRAVAPTVAPATVARSQAQIIGDIQRELSHKGFYDGTVDGIWGAKTDAAARDFVQAAGLKIIAEANEGLLQAIVTSNAKAQTGRAAAPVRNDPIAELIAPTKQVQSIQRALADFGYGQIKPTGVYDPETKEAIEKFERDRRLPVTGQISDQLVRDLAAMTGRPLE
ncbi:MAG TPA: peptidoglycan-binding domain-containing protein [Pseudolabrys sp.]|jgi:peptidoglycan hydrolase-like protein with peptidoglycan-binding domain